MGETCSVCGAPVVGASVLYAPDGRVACPTCFANFAPIGPPLTKPWRTFAIAGGVIGAIPFAFHMSSSSWTMVNGRITSSTYRDWIAVGCGVVAVALGAGALVAARKEVLQRALAFAASIGVLLLGAYQLARGFGAFEDDAAPQQLGVVFRGGARLECARAAADAGLDDACATLKQLK